MFNKRGFKQFEKKSFNQTKLNLRNIKIFNKTLTREKLNKNFIKKS